MKARYRKVQLLKAEARFEEALALAKELAAEEAGQFGSLVNEVELALEKSKQQVDEKMTGVEQLKGGQSKGTP